MMKMIEYFLAFMQSDIVIRRAEQADMNDSNKVRTTHELAFEKTRTQVLKGACRIFHTEPCTTHSNHYRYPVTERRK